MSQILQNIRFSSCRSGGVAAFVDALKCTNRLELKMFDQIYFSKSSSAKKTDYPVSAE